MTGADAEPVSPLVLSLFPGIGLLDMAFEEEGFCVVRGPDLLWGGDIKRFHPPAGRFDGVIGGPPCQAFSALRHLVENNGHKLAENLIPQFERCVSLARPNWYLMENVQDAPLPDVVGYQRNTALLRDHWIGGQTSRLRRFSFGTLDGRALRIETLALHAMNPAPAVVASSGGACTARRSGGAISKSRNAAGLAEARTLQGVPPDLDLSALTVRAQIKVVGNGVPLAMGRAVAKAVKRAIAPREIAA